MEKPAVSAGEEKINERAGLENRTGRTEEKGNQFMANMSRLEKEIIEQGIILNGDMLKVDTFLNHQIQPDLMAEIGSTIASAFREENITKVITIEAGGIAPALMTAAALNVPVVFCKKTCPLTMQKPLWANIHSFTKNSDATICVESSLISEQDRVLFVDDFLASGQAFLGVASLVEQAGAHLVGAAFCIEKTFQKGSEVLDEKGFPIFHWPGSARSAIRESNSNRKAEWICSTI